MNFAPILDVKRFGDYHAIGDRCFSEDIDIITKSGIKYINILKKYNVIPIIKHFPGHGATGKDTHFSIPKIKMNMQTLEKNDMIPFEKAIKNGADALLIGHLNLKKASSNLPATMSKKFITDWVRKKYRYNGLVITDDMRMRAVKILYGKNRPIVKAIKSGNDIILFKYLNNDTVINNIMKKVKKGKIKEKRINKSVKKKGY